LCPKAVTEADVATLRQRVSEDSRVQWYAFHSLAFYFTIRHIIWLIVLHRYFSPNPEILNLYIRSVLVVATTFLLCNNNSNII